MKVAATARACDIVTVQGSVPVQAPAQPVKADSATGVGTSVTELSRGISLLQVLPQLMPAGVETTLPVLLPLRVIDRVWCVSEKVAPTKTASFIVTEQVSDVPLQAPVQPVKADPATGLAVSFTTVRLLITARHELPQLMPAGAEVTLPPPVPSRVTSSVWVIRVNVAVTLRAAFIGSSQAPVPVQAPVHPAKREPAAGVGVSDTVASTAIGAVQADPQPMPAGEEAMLPAPVPARATVSVLWVRTKVAVTRLASDSVTLQTPVPVQAPPQPAKAEPTAGLALSESWVP